MLENSNHTQAPVVSLKKRIGYSLLAIVAVFALFIAANLLALLVVYLLNVIGLSLGVLGPNVAVFVINAIIWIAMLGLLIVPLQRSKRFGSLLELFGLKRLLSWGDIGMGFLAFIPYMIVTVLFATLAEYLLPFYDAAQEQDIGFEGLTNQRELILAFVALVIIAPVIEEMIFRGFLFSRLMKHVHVVAAVVLTSITFAVLHLQLNVAIDTFALSIFLCTLRVITGSIWAGVILHMAKNALAFFLLFVAPMLQ